MAFSSDFSTPWLLVAILLLLQCGCMKFFTLGIDMTIYNHTVKEGKSTQFECDSNATFPFYYYKFIPKNINPQIYLADTSEEWPWAVYAIYVSNSPANLRVIPSFLGRHEQPLNIPNISVDFNNILVCCQGYQNGKWFANDQNITSLSVMICYHVNVLFSPQTMQAVNPGQWMIPLVHFYGQRLVMSCPLEGNPSASYQWYFEKHLDLEKHADGVIKHYYEYDDGVLIQPKSILNISLLNNNRTLVFEALHEAHNGRYNCSAKNLLGNKNYTFPDIHVDKCTLIDPPKPSVTINGSHNLVAYVGDDLTIDCIVASYPQSHRIRWHKNESCDSDEITDNSSARVHFHIPSFDKIHCRQINTLYIKKLTFEDSGTYTCCGRISNIAPDPDSMLLTVTLPVRQPDYKSLIIKISVPVSVVIILIGTSVMLGFFYYLHVRQLKLQKALEKYRNRPLPKKGGYQYEFFFAMTDDDKDKLEVDKLYVVLKKSFSIYYQLDQYLPGRTKVEMVTEGIKNSRFIIIMLSKVYLQQKDETTQLELMYTMSRTQREFTKCAFIVTLEDNLSIPYKLRHITKFPKEGAEIKLKELALSPGPDSFPSEDNESVDDAMELQELNDGDTLI